MATIGIAAIAITFSFTQFRNAQQGQEKAEKMLNRAILLQNKVKIKYVNITNVLDYNYSKYNIDNVYELEYMWEKYLEEKEFRPIAMQVLAPSALKPEEAIEYVCRFSRIESILFGASSRNHIQQTKDLIDKYSLKL